MKAVINAVMPLWLKFERKFGHFRSHQMLALDAYSLLASRALQKRTASCCSSTPPSSIDLEWEIESEFMISLISRSKLHCRGIIVLG